MSTGAVHPECLRRCDEAALIEIVERAMHPSASEGLFLRELRVGTGRQNGGGQRLDAFALNTLPQMAMKRVCYEVKTSRADFLSELKRALAAQRFAYLGLILPSQTEIMIATSFP